MTENKSFSISIEGPIPPEELLRQKNLVGLDTTVLIDCALSREVMHYIVNLPISKRGIFYTTEKNVEEAK